MTELALPSAVRTAPITPRGARILLVDDDDPVRRSLQLLLQATGYDVRAYPSSIRAADDLQARSCDCLIADLMLPGLDGIALLGCLRRSGWTGPAILISGLLDQNEVAAANAAGFGAIFAKPTSESVLVRAIESMLRAPRES